jgi:acyl-coenzyme A thioesterase PaaI-like protein
MMEFYEEGEEVISYWSPRESFRGYDSFLHGGIQTTLMDEIAAWAVFVKVKTAGVTSRIDARFLKPVYTDRGQIELRARLEDLVKNIAKIRVRLFDSDKVLCSESLVECFTYPQKIALRRLHYPGYEKFYD